jgi:hypothetical protein
MRASITFYLILLLASVASGDTTILTDEFGTDSASNYIITKTSDDTSIQFGFDASSIGVPNSPHGDNIVLRTAVNIAAPDSYEVINAYLNFTSLPTNYIAQVDIYIRCPGVGMTGSTEHTGLGLFGSGTKINYLYPAGTFPTNTDGLVFGYNTDGDEIYSDFYLNQGSAIGPTSVGTWTGPDPTPGGQFYQDYASLFSIPTNPDGYQLFFNQWATVSLSYNDGVVTGKINNDTYVTYTPSEAQSGLVFLAHSDPYDSVAADPNLSFCLFDHLVITEPEAPPPPLSARDWEVYE